MKLFNIYAENVFDNNCLTSTYLNRGIILLIKDPHLNTVESFVVLLYLHVCR